MIAELQVEATIPPANFPLISTTPFPILIVAVIMGAPTLSTFPVSFKIPNFEETAFYEKNRFTIGQLVRYYILPFFLPP